MTKEEIGDILRQLRLSCNMTQKEVAEKIGRKQQIIGHWETGYSQPDANTLFILCDIYNTTVDEAFGFKKDDVSYAEMQHIKKYRALNKHGKEIVDFVLEKEYQNSQVKEVEQPTTRLVNYYYKLASAGTGQIIFDTPPTKTIEIPDTYKNVDYAIGVNGDSMNPVFLDGDTLLVQMTNEINIGDIGIFHIDGQCYVKKLGKNELISINKQYKNIPLNETAKCMGKVIDKF